MRKDALELIIRNLKGIRKALDEKELDLVKQHIKAIITILEKEITQEKLT
jgi:hypothetical protein